MMVHCYMCVYYNFIGLFLEKKKTEPEKGIKRTYDVYMHKKKKFLVNVK